jgi:hypothetical protein
MTALGFVDLYDINVDIWRGQSGNRVEDKVETTVGSFTVANLNNTDGDKNADGSERIDKDDEIVATDPNFPELTPGTDEVDLMLLMIKKPTDPNPDGSKLKITLTGDLKLWQKKTKEIPEPRREFSLSDLDHAYNPFYVEVCARSQNLRDLAVTVEYRGQTDTVRATGIWSWSLETFHDGESAAGVFNACPDIRNPVRGRIGYYGGVGLRPSSPTYGLRNVMLIKFYITPEGVGKEHGVKFDATRQREGGQWYWDPTMGWVPVIHTYWPPGDKANDDGHFDDESEVPTEPSYFYQMDAPGPQSETAGWPRAIQRNNFYEFMRVNFDNVRPGLDRVTGRPVNNLDGSRVSVKFKWSARHNLETSDGKWVRSTGNVETLENYVGPMHFNDVHTYPG